MPDPKDVRSISVRPGDPIKASEFMLLAQAVADLQDMTCGTGIDIRRVGGKIHLSAIAESNSYLGVATSNFAPRSGTTPGTGTVDIYWYDGTNLATAGKSMNAICVTAAPTMTSGNSIDSGMYCWVERDAYGVWYVAPLECS